MTHTINSPQCVIQPSNGRERGQALVIVAVGIFTLLILVGLAVDLGLYYIERVRIARAVDAATLAAAYELPMESAAHLQALDYLRQNGYDFADPGTVLFEDVGGIITTTGDARTAIQVDTAMFQDPPYGNQNSAFRIQVQVRRLVPVVFLRFAGFDNIACYASSIAENINNLDIALAFDRSGSMEFDTLCYGCWDDDGNPYSRYVTEDPEPGVDNLPCHGGACFPLPWDGPANGTPEHCEPTTSAYQDDGHDYYFIEAEEYSYTNNAFSRATYGTGYSYWVLQRQPSTTSSRDGQGGHIMHMPYPDLETSGVGATCRHEDIDSDGDGYVTDAEGKCWSGTSLGPFQAPRVDYNFSPLADDGYYIWVRAQAYGSSGNRGDELDRRLFWGIDQIGDGLPVQLGWGQSGTDCGNRLGCEGDFMRGGNEYTNGATSWNWEWRRLNDNPYNMVAGTQYNLSFWAGGSHFALDRIVITNDHNDYDYLEPLQANSGRGVEEWANGRGGYACEPCDDRFAGYPANGIGRPGGFNPSGWVHQFPVCEQEPNPDRRMSFLYDDEQPIRGSKEAVKLFITEIMTPTHDQIGYISYSNNASIQSHLRCLRYEADQSDCTLAKIESEVIAPVETTSAGGGTSIGGALAQALVALETDPLADCRNETGSCGRPGATHVIILMTDGRPTAGPTGCADLWPNDGISDAFEDCVIQNARDARDRNVIIFTITVGESADFELMAEVAEITGGAFRPATRPEQLPDIFAELYELMYLRLVK